MAVNLIVNGQFDRMMNGSSSAPVATSVAGQLLETLSTPAASGSVAPSGHPVTSPGNTSLATHTLTNTGQGALAVTDVSVGALTGFQLDSHNCPSQLPVGASCSAVTRYSPTTVAAASGSIRFNTTAGLLTGTVALPMPVAVDILTTASNLPTSLTVVSSGTLDIQARNASTSSSHPAVGVRLHLPTVQGLSLSNVQCTSGTVNGNACDATLASGGTVRLLANYQVTASAGTQARVVAEALQLTNTTADPNLTNNQVTLQSSVVAAPQNDVGVALTNPGLFTIGADNWVPTVIQNLQGNAVIAEVQASVNNQGVLRGFDFDVCGRWVLNAGVWTRVTAPVAARDSSGVSCTFNESTGILRLNLSAGGALRGNVSLAPAGTTSQAALTVSASLVNALDSNPSNNSQTVQSGVSPLINLGATTRQCGPAALPYSTAAARPYSRMAQFHQDWFTLSDGWHLCPLYYITGSSSAHAYHTFGARNPSSLSGWPLGTGTLMIAYPTWNGDIVQNRGTSMSSNSDSLYHVLHYDRRSQSSTDNYHSEFFVVRTGRQGEVLGQISNLCRESGRGFVSTGHGVYWDPLSQVIRCFGKDYSVPNDLVGGGAEVRTAGLANEYRHLLERPYVLQTTRTATFRLVAGHLSLVDNMTGAVTHLPLGQTPPDGMWLYDGSNRLYGNLGTIVQFTASSAQVIQGRVGGLNADNIRFERFPQPRVVYLSTALNPVRHHQIHELPLTGPLPRAFTYGGALPIPFRDGQLPQEGLYPPM